MELRKALSAGATGQQQFKDTTTNSIWFSVARETVPEDYNHFCGVILKSCYIRNEAKY